MKKSQQNNKNLLNNRNIAEIQIVYARLYVFSLKKLLRFLANSKCSLELYSRPIRVMQLITFAMKIKSFTFVEDFVFCIN